MRRETLGTLISMYATRLVDPMFVDPSRSRSGAARRDICIQTMKS